MFLVNNYFDELSSLPDDIKILPLTSDPTKIDSDNDGILDNLNNNIPKNGYYLGSKDTEPLIKGLKDGIIGELTIVSCDNSPAGHGFFVYRSYINDSFDFSRFTGGYLIDEWEYINTSKMETYKYYIHPNDNLAIGNAGSDVIAGSSGVGAHLNETSDDINNGNLAGVYFNREFAYDYKHSSEKNGKSSYSNNYAYTRKVTETQMSNVINYAKSENYYNLTSHNCVHFVISAWNRIFPDDSFVICTMPSKLKKKIKDKNGSFTFDIMEEVL